MGFDTLAPFYLAMETVLAGPLLHRCRTSFLSETSSARTALLLGEGPGRYLLELLRFNPAVRITALDASRRMLAAAQQYLQSNDCPDQRVRFIQADCLTWPDMPGPYDLIATHFFLDCFRADQLASLVPKIAATASPKALWILSDFCVPATGWQRIRARVVLKLAYAFFRCATRLSASHLTLPDPFLAASGFQLIKRRIIHHGLLHADVWGRTAASRAILGMQDHTVEPMRRTESSRKSSPSF